MKISFEKGKQGEVGAMTTEDDALALKEKGNKAFKEHDWPTAIECYTKAIELNDREVSFYTNRSQVCYIS